MNVGIFSRIRSKRYQDREVVSLAKEKRAILLTRDSDFASSSVPPHEFFGIVVFRIHPPKPDKIVKALSLHLEGVKKLLHRSAKKGFNTWSFPFKSESLYGILLK